MARVVQMARNHLYDELALQKKRRLQIVFVSLLGVILFLGGPITGKPTVSLTGLLITLVGYMWHKKIHTAVDIITAGITGEEQAGAVFAALPDAYTVYSDLSITVDDKGSQLDHVVVGPTGIFVIETKHMTGVIRGGPDDKRWIQSKLNRQRDVQEHEFYSPMKQVGTHVYRLSQLLRSAHIHTWVQGIVYFSHEDVHVQVMEGKIPVFSHAHGGDMAIIRYILTFAEKEMGGNTQERIDDVIKDIMTVSS